MNTEAIQDLLGAVAYAQQRAMLAREALSAFVKATATLRAAEKEYYDAHDVVEAAGKKLGISVALMGGPSRIFAPAPEEVEAQQPKEGQ